MNYDGNVTMSIRNIPPTELLTYLLSDLLAHGFTAAKWTCGRSARPPSLS